MTVVLSCVWLAYSKNIPNRISAIMIYDTKEHKSWQVTSNYYWDYYPVFDPEGKYLFFLSNRSFSPLYSDMDATWIYPNSTEIYAATLRKDVISSIAPRSDEEKPEEEKTEEREKEEDRDNDEEKDSEPEKNSNNDKEDDIGVQQLKGL